MKVHTDVAEVFTLLFLVVLMLSDASVHIMPLVEPVFSGCDVLILDPYHYVDSAPSTIRNMTVCLVHRLGPSDMRVLWGASAKYIIIVTHFFKGEEPGVYGLGTERSFSILEYIAHPLMQAYFVRGNLDSNTSYLAVNTAFLRTGISGGFNGKKVFLITCGFSGIDAVQDDFLAAGAGMVAVPTVYDLPSTLVNKYVHDAMAIIATGKCPHTFVCRGGAV